MPSTFLSNLQHSLDATLSTFLSNLQHALDVTISTFWSNLQHALGATPSTFSSKHLFPALFHDACIMKSKHKNIQNFISSVTDSAGDWHSRNFWKKSAKQLRHANASETRGKSASAFSDNKLKSDVSLWRKRHLCWPDAHETTRQILGRAPCISFQNTRL